MRNSKTKGKKNPPVTFIPQAKAAERLENFSTVITIEENSKRSLIPKYVIKNILSVRPNSVDDLTGIAGLTAETISKYGQDIVDIIHKGYPKSRIHFLDKAQSLDAKIYAYSRYHTLTSLRQKESESNSLVITPLVEYLSCKLENSPDYFREKLVELKILRPLYHGTDLRILKMGENERQQYSQACERIIEKFISIPRELKQAAMDALSGKIQDEEYLENLYDAEKVIERKTIGAPQYQFDCIAFASRDYTARHFAIESYSFGQFGKTAYTLGRFMHDYFPEQVPEGSQLEKDFRLLCEFAEGPRQPVIVIVSHYSLADLILPDGSFIPEKVMSSFLDSRRPISDISDTFLYRENIDLTQFGYDEVQIAEPA